MILIDNNLSFKLKNRLNDLFGGATHVEAVGLGEVEDEVIWAYATKHHYHILTKDTDFNDLQQIKGFPPKIIWIRIGNSSTKEIANKITLKQQEILKFLADDNFGIIEIW